MPTPPKEGKLLYHMTSLENMSSILKYGLLSRKYLKEHKTDFEDIANPGILAGREHIQAQAFRSLHEYVPFHFFAGNPFDGVVCKRDGPENKVIIAITREWAESLGSSYILTAHPLHPSAKCLPYHEGIDAIDWSALESRDYHNNDIKQKCMAECLVPDCVPRESFYMIWVYDDDAKKQIDDIPIDICPYLLFPNFDCAAKRRKPCDRLCIKYWYDFWRGNFIQVNPYMFPPPRRG